MVLIAIGLYIATAVAVMVMQRRMIYQPSTASEKVLRAVARNEGFEPWLNVAGQTIGWRRLGTHASPCLQALIVHGNAGYALDRADYAKALQAAALFDVFILEYPGYGSRPGAASQASLFQAADEALDLLRTNGPVYVIGESLGTGVAAHLAGAHANEVAGLLLFTPYNNLIAVAQHHMPIFPVAWMLWDRFPSEDLLHSYRGPIGFLLAGNDEVVPDKFGRRLYEAYQGPKKLWEAPKAGHNDVHSQPLDWWKEVVAFWNLPIQTMPGK
jgi:hypothetical protein